MISKKKVLEIKDYVKCPQTRSKKYGKWSALRPDQRILIDKLCDSWLDLDKTLRTIRKTNKILVTENKLLFEEDNNLFKKLFEEDEC